MSRDAMPAIVREVQDRDMDAEVIRRYYDGVTFTRGLGDSGRRIEIVEYDCPACSHDRMVRDWDVSPCGPDTVRYYCLSPACPHHVGDALSHRRHGSTPHEPAIRLDEPETWDDA